MKTKYLLNLQTFYFTNIMSIIQFFLYSYFNDKYIMGCDDEVIPSV